MMKQPAHPVISNRRYQALTLNPAIMESTKWFDNGIVSREY